MLAGAEGHAGVDLDDDVPVDRGKRLPGGFDDDVPARAKRLEVLLPRLPPAGIADDLRLKGRPLQFGEDFRQAFDVSPE